MKTIRQFTMRFLAIAVTTVAYILPSNAQTLDKLYANIDWQYNFPIGIDFADKSSGWGMNFEGGYFITPNIAVGGCQKIFEDGKTGESQCLRTADLAKGLFGIRKPQSFGETLRWFHQNFCKRSLRQRTQQRRVG